MATTKAVSQEVLDSLVDKIQEIVNNYCWNLEYFTAEECESFFDGTQEEIDYYSSIIKDNVISKNFLHSSRQIADDIASAIIQCNDYADNLIKNISSIKLEYVTSLPVSNISENTIYILKSADSSAKDTLNLYNSTNGWTEIGSFDIDLKDYIDKTTYNNDMNLKANKDEVVSNDKVVQTLDSSTNSSDTILSTNGLQQELDKKINKTNIITKISTTSPSYEKVTSESSVVKCIEDMSKEKDVTWVEYQALSEEEKNNGITYYVSDMPVSDTYTTYSTKEMIIGKWIDGKPIYRKVIDLGTLPNTDTVRIPHNIDNLDRIISMNGMAKSLRQNLLLPFPYGLGKDGFNSDGTVKVNTVPINIYEEQGNIVVYTLSDRSDMTGYVILEYIKTNN